MPVSKKRKFPNKRNKRTRPVIIPAPSGFVANISYGGFDIPDGLVNALRNEGMRYHALGREDKANGAAALSLDEFKAKFYSNTPGLPEVFGATIAEAQHTQYLDGYTGADYCDRVIFKKDNI